jgi:hypothetical protein
MIIIIDLQFLLLFSLLLTRIENIASDDFVGGLIVIEAFFSEM